MGELIRLNGGGNRSPESFLAEAEEVLAHARERDLLARTEAARARRLLRQARRHSYEATTLFGLAVVAFLVAGAALVAGGAWAAVAEFGFVAWLVCQLRRRGRPG